MTSNCWEVPVVTLRARFDAQDFPFATPEDLSNLEHLIAWLLLGAQGGYLIFN